MRTDTTRLARWLLPALLFTGCPDDASTSTPDDTLVPGSDTSEGFFDDATGEGDAQPSTPDVPVAAEDTSTTLDVPGVPDAAPPDDVSAAPDVALADAAPPEDVASPEDVAATPDASPSDAVATEDVSGTPDTESDDDTSDPVADTEATPDVAVPEPPQTTCDGPCPEGTICNSGVCGDEVCGNAEFDALLFAEAAGLAGTLLQSQQPDLSWAPSSIYRWVDLLQALHTSCGEGIGGFAFWLGEPDDAPSLQATMGLVNLAAFLAQSMKETIKYDACDENNWDNTNGYKMTNACGQLGQSYEDYDCEMACPKDPTMQVTAVTNATWYGAPGPLFCAPDSVLIEAGVTSDGTTGYWNHNTDCWPYPATEDDFEVADLPAWMRPDCEIYAGQKGGQWVWDGSAGSVEGCCWWGRGVIQTTGRCNFGTLNHYLGTSHLDATAFPAPANPPYPTVDFCKDPGVICASEEFPELKWIAGLFYWMSSVQTYDVDGWAYTAQLRAYVEGGLSGSAFIDAVSAIVNRGCHDPPCATGAVDGMDERRANFESALSAMGLK